jgi:hypothetical protein
VLGWIEPGNERGPGHWALRRISCRKAAEMAAIAKLGKIRKRIPVFFHEGWIHSIDTQYDDTGHSPRRFWGAAAGKKQKTGG